MLGHLDTVVRVAYISTMLERTHLANIKTPEKAREMAQHSLKMAAYWRALGRTTAAWSSETDARDYLAHAEKLEISGQKGPSQ